MAKIIKANKVGFSLIEIDFIKLIRMRKPSVAISLFNTRLTETFQIFVPKEILSSGRNHEI